jgi:hypothetical protein
MVEVYDYNNGVLAAARHFVVGWPNQESDKAGSEIRIEMALGRGFSQALLQQKKRPGQTTGREER